MTAYAPGGGALAAKANEIYVDGAYAGAQENGSFAAPYTTITAALAAAAAGDLIKIAPGVYTEDLTLVDGVDLQGAQAQTVSVVGSAVATDITLNIENVDFIDDGAGVAFHYTGTAADALICFHCDFSATATGGHALEIDNTAGAVTLDECTGGADAANANEVVRIESGTVNMKDCAFQHGSNVAESVVLEGDAATTFWAEGCTFTGIVASEAAVANPTATLRSCDITVGAVSAGIVAAGNTVTLIDVDVTSTDAAQDAFDGAGTLLVSNVKFLSTADEYATTLTVSQIVTSLTQHGRYTEAAGAGTRAITFAQVMPTADYTVSVTYQDTGAGAQASSNEIDTLATTGFNITTQVNGIYHWIAIHD